MYPRGQGRNQRRRESDCQERAWHHRRTRFVSAGSDSYLSQAFQGVLKLDYLFIICVFVAVDKEINFREEPGSKMSDTEVLLTESAPTSSAPQEHDSEVEDSSDDPITVSVLQEHRIPSPVIK